MPRVIYSLLFELEPEKRGTALSLVVPLNAAGQAVNVIAGDQWAWKNGSTGTSKNSVWQ